MDKNLAQFLLAAKKSTYAGAKGDSKKMLDDGAREFDYTNDAYMYRDRYFGSDPFAGEEVVFSNDQAVWIMNYRGYITDKTVGEEYVYTFLKQALREVTEDAPFRGPAQLTAGEYQYIMEFSGDPDSFAGSEKIYYGKRIVYKLFFHGGIIVY